MLPYCGLLFFTGKKIKKSKKLSDHTAAAWAGLSDRDLHSLSLSAADPQKGCDIATWQPQTPSRTGTGAVTVSLARSYNHDDRITRLSDTVTVVQVTGTVTVTVLA